MFLPRHCGLQAVYHAVVRCLSVMFVFLSKRVNIFYHRIARPFLVFFVPNLMAIFRRHPTLHNYVSCCIKTYILLTFVKLYFIYLLATLCLPRLVGFRHFG